MLNEENTLIITQDDGEEKMLAIMFTFVDPSSNKEYVVACDPDDEDLIYGFRKDVDQMGNDALIPVDPDENEEEFEMVSEVLNAFADEIEDDIQDSEGE